jgi:hypothetical protein
MKKLLTIALISALTLLPARTALAYGQSECVQTALNDYNITGWGCTASVAIGYILAVTQTEGIATFWAGQAAVGAELVCLEAAQLVLVNHIKDCIAQYPSTPTPTITVDPSVTATGGNNSNGSPVIVYTSTYGNVPTVPIGTVTVGVPVVVG